MTIMDGLWIVGYLLGYMGTTWVLGRFGTDPGIAVLVSLFWPVGLPLSLVLALGLWVHEQAREP